MAATRRDILKLGTGTAAAWMVGARFAWSAKPGFPNKIPLGLGLWSVRHQCENELPTVLEALAEMGYESVELAHSYYGHDAQAWRRLLDENGLKSCGMHMGLAALEGDAFQKTVETQKIIGTPYVIIASLPKKNLESVQAIVETGKKFNELASRLKEHDLKIGYHCHGGDFAKVEGRIAWEVFGENTSDDVILQLDMGNCLGGGGDPIAMLNKFPGRSVSVHLKDHGGKPDFVFGEGTVDWKQVFAICESTGGTKQYIIEEEGRQGTAALDAVRRAIGNYRKMRA